MPRSHEGHKEQDFLKFAEIKLLATSGRSPASRYERVHHCWREIANPIACNGRFCLKQNRVAIQLLDLENQKDISGERLFIQ